MNKLKEFGLIVFASLAFLLSTTHVHVTAGIFDTVKNTITGHVDDIKSRFDTDRPVLEFEQSDVVKRGKIDVNAIGQDFLHNSEGTVAIVTSGPANYLVLSDNFDSSPGPDYHVYISKKAKILDESGFNEVEQIELGKLQYGNGFQFYEIPANIDINEINSFLLWCKAFGAYIGSADLK